MPSNVIIANNSSIVTFDAWIKMRLQIKCTRLMYLLFFSWPSWLGILSPLNPSSTAGAMRESLNSNIVLGESLFLITLWVSCFWWVSFFSHFFLSIWLVGFISLILPTYLFQGTWILKITCNTFKICVSSHPGLWISISELLNPEDKTLLGSTPTTKEIHELAHVSQDDSEDNMIKTEKIPTTSEAIRYLNGLVGPIKWTATPLGLKLDQLLQKLKSNFVSFFQ